MLKIIRHAQVFSPRAIGLCDILIADGRIAKIDKSIDLSGRGIEEFDAEGQIVAPGLVDTLVHITGGGGEGGFSTRTPELQFSDAVSGGVTSLIGALGTDATTRSLGDLHGKARALTEQGLSCFHYTGAYQIPSPTITGSVRNDMIFIDSVVGAGEVAIADHRGSQPTAAELARLAADVKVGGLLTGKKGIVSIHVGEHPQQLDLLLEVARDYAVHLSQFYPTHMNRTQSLLDTGVEFVKRGGVIDFTASTTDQLLAMGELRASKAMAYALSQSVPLERITLSSDAQGSLPHFNERGELESLQVGKIQSLLEEFKMAVTVEGVEVSDALATVTQNPADIVGLKNKGRIAVGVDADLIVMEKDALQLNSVMAKGAWLMRERKPCVKATVEV